MLESTRFPFTERRLRKEAVPPAKGLAYYFDTGQRGLGVYVTPAGARTYFLQCRYGGRSLRVRLGRFPDMKLKEARVFAREKLTMIDQGLDPRRQLGGMVLDDLWQEYLQKHLQPHKKSWRETERLWKLHLKGLRWRRLDDILPRDVQRLHVRLGRYAGHRTANKAADLLRAMFNRALRWRLWKGDNPAQHIERFSEATRDRFLQPEEAPRFFTALRIEPNMTIRDFFLMALLTGARKGNVLAMRWGQIHMDRALWTIPASEAKEGDPILVPLVPDAVTVLFYRNKWTSGPWVFPARSKSGHLENPQKAWQRLCKVAKLKDLRIHDLRRTLGSWQAAQGVSLPIIGKSLGHRSTEATEIYARLHLDPVRSAMEQATKAILGAGETEARDGEST